MTVIGNSLSVPKDSTYSNEISPGNTVGQSTVSLSDISSLLQEVFQKMRDTLQKQNVSQSINSFKLAKSAIDKKHKSTDEAMKASLITAGVGGGGAILGGLIGMVPTIAKGVGKLSGKIQKQDLGAIKALYRNNPEQALKEAKGNFAATSLLRGERWNEAFSALSPAVSGLATSAGGLAAADPTHEASRLQTAADYLKDSQSVYDKQRDNDVNNMHMFSQKITETSRSLAELHAATMNALNWK